MSLDQLTSSLNTGISSLNSFSRATKEVSGSLTSTGEQVYRTNESLIKLNRTLLQGSRDWLAYGVSTEKYRQTLGDLSKATNLSRQELADLFSTTSNGLLGVNKNLSTVSNLIEKLSDVGVFAEETKTYIDSLSRAALKFPDVIDKIMSGGKLDFGEMMQLDLNDVRNIESLTAALAKEVKEPEGIDLWNRSMKEMQKTVTDASILFQETFAPVISTVAKTVTSLLNFVKPLSDVFKSLSGGVTNTVLAYGLLGGTVLVGIAAIVAMFKVLGNLIGLKKEDAEKTTEQTAANEKLTQQVNTQAEAIKKLREELAALNAERGKSGGGGAPETGGGETKEGGVPEPKEGSKKVVSEMQEQAKEKKTSFVAQMTAVGSIATILGSILSLVAPENSGLAKFGGLLIKIGMGIALLGSLASTIIAMQGTQLGTMIGTAVNTLGILLGISPLAVISIAVAAIAGLVAALWFASQKGKDKDTVELEKKAKRDEERFNATGGASEGSQTSKNYAALQDLEDEKDRIAKRYSGKENAVMSPHMMDKIQNSLSPEGKQARDELKALEENKKRMQKVFDEEQEQYAKRKKAMEDFDNGKDSQELKDVKGSGQWGQAIQEKGARAAEEKVIKLQRELLELQKADEVDEEAVKKKSQELGEAKEHRNKIDVRGSGDGSTSVLALREMVEQARNAADANKQLYDPTNAEKLSKYHVEHTRNAELAAKFAGEAAAQQKQVIAGFQNEVDLMAETVKLAKAKFDAALPEDKEREKLKLMQAQSQEQLSLNRLAEANLRTAELEIEALTAGLDARMKQSEQMQGIADAQSKLANASMLGIGYSAAAMKNVAEQKIQQAEIAKEAVKEVETAKQKKEEEYKIAVAAGQTEKAASIKEQIDKMQVTLNERNITALNKQASAMEEINKLRRGYLDALEENSWGIGEMSLVPTQGGGMAVMGEGHVEFGGRAAAGQMGNTEVASKIDPWGTGVHNTNQSSGGTRTQQMTDSDRRLGFNQGQVAKDLINGAGELISRNANAAAQGSGNAAGAMASDKMGQLQNGGPGGNSTLTAVVVDVHANGFAVGVQNTPPSAGSI